MATTLAICLLISDRLELIDSLAVETDPSCIIVRTKDVSGRSEPMGDCDRIDTYHYGL